MMTDPAPPAQATAPITDRTLIRVGAALTMAAGVLRLPASLIDADADGAAVETLYYVIDVSLLFAVITSYVTIAASRTLLGTVGFAMAVVGTGLLIGPEPPDADVDYYAIGATAVTLGFAALAIAWRHSRLVTRSTRWAFLAAVVIGLLSGLHAAALVVAGVFFSIGLLQLGHRLLYCRLDEEFRSG